MLYSTLSILKSSELFSSYQKFKEACTHNFSTTMLRRKDRVHYKIKLTSNKLYWIKQNDCISWLLKRWDKIESAMKLFYEAGGGGSTALWRMQPCLWVNIDLVETDTYSILHFSKRRGQWPENKVTEVLPWETKYQRSFSLVLMQPRVPTVGQSAESNGDLKWRGRTRQSVVLGGLTFCWQPLSLWLRPCWHTDATNLESPLPLTLYPVDRGSTPPRA